MNVPKKFQKISKKIPKKVKWPTVRSSRIYEFGSFRLDQVERVLLRGAEQLSLTPKVFDILSVLVESAGRLVTKERLLEEVWPGAFVEEANLSVNIATLRKVLGERASEPKYIKTVAKVGYRFVAGVVVIESDRGLETLTANHSTSLSQSSTSLAVLPFGNDRADPHVEYLSDGLTESIINCASQLPGLQ